MKNIYEKLSEASLEIGALRLNVKNPFLWASGYYMPVYNDNRLFLQNREYRRMITKTFASIIKKNRINPEAVAGTSTAGIPHAALLADKLDLPLTYVRNKPKDHGLGNRIEGLDAERGYEGRRVVLIEDLISTGGSSIAALKAVREAGGKIEYCLSIFTYGLSKAEEEFSSLTPQCRAISILSYDKLIHTAEKSGYISKDDVKSLEEWRKSPFDWGSNYGFPPKTKGGQP